MLAVSSIFGKYFFISGAESIILLVVFIAAAVCTLAVIAFVITVTVMFKRSKRVSARELVDPTVDASDAERNFHDRRRL